MEKLSKNSKNYVKKIILWVWLIFILCVGIILFVFYKIIKDLDIEIFIFAWLIIIVISHFMNLYRFKELDKK